LAKQQPYSRRELTRLRNGWLRRNRGVVATVAAIALGILAGSTALAVTFAGDSRFAWYLLGVVQAAVIAICLHFLYAGFLAGERDAMRHLRGAWGEENTSTELEAAKRRRVIWGWVDGISLQAGDIDHVVVTRRGGVVVIDSKWRNRANAQEALDMAAAVKKVRVRAEAVTRTVVSSERRARHRASGGSVVIRPAVVSWGAEQHRLPNGVAHVDGIDFVAGSHLRKWLRSLEGDEVSKDAAAELVRLLEQLRARVSASEPKIGDVTRTS
jgi:hypothetical protein